MTFYQIKRNVPVEFKIMIFLIILAGIITTLFVVKIDVDEEYTESIPIQKLLTNNTQKIINTSKLVNNTRIINESVNFEIIKDSFVRNRYNDGKKYLYQDYEIFFDESITFCVEGFYRFYEKSRLVNKNNFELCFDDEMSKEIKFKELYTEDKDDYYFKINITKTPQKQIVLKNITYEYEPKVINVTTNETIVEFENITKTRTNKISLIKWIVG
ncbi:hypothetical protein KY321_05300 [Candidatus Woesearchaeota archaeon]|nr:hypothetical protein [Candidatus Woesearchaeota archaeon]